MSDKSNSCKYDISGMPEEFFQICHIFPFGLKLVDKGQSNCDSQIILAIIHLLTSDKLLGKCAISYNNEVMTSFKFYIQKVEGHHHCDIIIHSKKKENTLLVIIQHHTCN